MNPLTLVKRTQKINSTEAALGISEEASWHAKYKESAYIFVGGIPFDLTEGDLLAVFAHFAIDSRNIVFISWIDKYASIKFKLKFCGADESFMYGEVVDVNLVRDKATGKSKGFAFLAYEDQRSTILAVDNLNGAKVLGRIIRVDHVSNYKKKEEEDEEERKKKREARGVCRAFQRGECKWGDACKFSHDEQRSANTGWGAKDSDSRWNHDRYDDPPKSHKSFSQRAPNQPLDQRAKEDDSKPRTVNKDGHSSRVRRYEDNDYRESRRDKHSERQDTHRDKRQKHDREFARFQSREDEESPRRAYR